MDEFIIEHATRRCYQNYFDLFKKMSLMMLLKDETSENFILLNYVSVIVKSRKVALIKLFAIF